jgi:NAD(P)-dependent dehydrogenase (short-subunit alcohol dehydrogenase family)
MKQASASSSFRVDGKVAIVSGGAGICGTPIVTALAEAGAHVVIASRDVAKNSAFVQSLSKAGLSAEAVQLDLTAEKSVLAVRDDLLQRHGRIDVLINNSVARAGGDLRHSSADNWEQTMRVNATGLFLACKIFSEPMQEARAGSIVNISSIYGMVGPDFSIYENTGLTNPVNYAFAKGGMINLTRYLASFLAPHNVRVNCISLGGIQTDETPENFIPNYARRTPMQRMGRPEDIKGAIVFFASDASGYITGQNLAIDGGWTAI